MERRLLVPEGEGEREGFGTLAEPTLGHSNHLIPYQILPWGEGVEVEQLRMDWHSLGQGHSSQVGGGSGTCGGGGGGRIRWGVVEGLRHMG